MKGQESPQQEAFTIAGFCKAHGISKGMFYILLGENRAPETMLVGRRRLISREAAEKWRERMTRITSRKAA